MKKVKKMKVYSKFRARRWGNTTVSEIRLEGKWLEELGFKEGREFLVKPTKEELIIKLLPKEEK